MSEMWRTPERHVEDLDFFTKLYEATEWLMDRRAQPVKEGDFMTRWEGLNLCESELENVAAFMSEKRFSEKPPESLQVILQGRNPRVYRDSPGAAVEIIMRTRNEFTIYAFVNGYEQESPEQHRTNDAEPPERALSIVKASLKVTNWNLAGHSGIADPRTWHDERFKVNKMYKEEGLKILDLITFLS